MPNYVFMMPWQNLVWKFDLVLKIFKEIKWKLGQWVSLLTCTSIVTENSEFLANFQKSCFTACMHGLYVMPKHLWDSSEMITGMHGHIFMGDLVITCSYFGRWVHLGFKTIPNLNFQISCIFWKMTSNLAQGYVDSHMPNDDCTVLCQFGLKFSKKKVAKTKI